LPKIIQFNDEEKFIFSLNKKLLKRKDFRLYNTQVLGEVLKKREYETKTLEKFLFAHTLLEVPLFN